MSISKTIRIRIIWPSSPESSISLEQQIAKTKSIYGVEFHHNPSFCSDLSVSSRDESLNIKSKALLDALTEADTTAVLCARGGYGASDLLPYLPWSTLQKTKPKLLIGFSDISALHSGLYAKLNWPSLHGPMPATEYWLANGQYGDLTRLFDLLSCPVKQGSMVLQSLNDLHPRTSGWTFGGCFSVLTNLIGTPYFPKTLSGSILFWEDIGETDLKLCRYLNQWLYSGVLSGVSAIVLGSFTGLSHNPVEGRQIKCNIWQLLKEHLKATGIPLFSSEEFGHQNPNYPIIIGANAFIENSCLTWQLSQEKGVS